MVKWLVLVFCVMSVLSRGRDGIHPDLNGFRYPALARAARRQGTVRFLVTKGEIQLLSGHPMLVASAGANLDKWALAQSVGREFEVDYVFQVTPRMPDTVEMVLPIATRADRFLLHIFRRPTTRTVVVRGVDCGEPKDSLLIQRTFDENGRQVIVVRIDGESCAIETQPAVIG